MRSDLLEASVEQRLRKGVLACRGVCIKLGQEGWPDRVCLYPRGLLHFVELKRPRGGVVSPLQTYKHGILRRLGFDVFVLHTPEAVEEYLTNVRKQYDV